MGKLKKKNKHAGHIRHAGGFFFWKINKRAGGNKCAGGILFQNINFVHKLVLLMDINLSNVMKYNLAARELLTMKYKSH